MYPVLSMVLWLGICPLLAAQQRLPADLLGTAESPVVKPAINNDETRPSPAIRALVVLLGLAAWYATQHLIGSKEPLPADQAKIAGELLTQQDKLLQLSGSINRFLHARPRWANALLIVSSALIDALGLFLLLWSIFGPSIGPFLGLMILFGLRQICQALTALPMPAGMIWRSPGFPTLLVTYGVTNDLFFSGHTAMAVYGAVQLAQLGLGWLIAAIFLAVFEIIAVLVLRAHYTLDVFTGLVSALFIAGLAGLLAPGCDRFLAQMFH